MRLPIPEYGLFEIFTLPGRGNHSKRLYEDDFHVHDIWGAGHIKQGVFNNDVDDGAMAGS